MITFLCGKIPGVVKEVVFDGDSLTIANAVIMGAEACGFEYNTQDVVYLNGDVASNDVLVNDGDVILVDIPKIVGNQMTAKIGRNRSVLSYIALHNDSTVQTAITVAAIPGLTVDEEVYVNGILGNLTTHITEGDIIVIKTRVAAPVASDTTMSRNTDIYKAIATLLREVAKLVEKAGL